MVCCNITVIMVCSIITIIMILIMIIIFIVGYTFNEQTEDKCRATD